MSITPQAPDASAHTPTVFISYSSADKYLARRVARRLVHSGARVIIDEVDLRPGIVLTRELELQIGRATHIVVVWTQSAAASPWVAREIEFARRSSFLPVVIPFLAGPVERDSAVSDLLGVPFPCVYQFERAFENLRNAIIPIGASEPSYEQLREDLAAAVEELPSLAGILRNPVEDLYAALEAKRTPAEAETEFRNRNFGALQEAFGAWGPEAVSTVGLPTAAGPEYHALDFALWCASHLTLIKRAILGPTMPIEVKAYPAIFAKVFAATQAGYEALIALLPIYRDFTEALLPLTDRSLVADSSIPGVVALFQETIAMCQREPTTKDQFTPYGTLAVFLSRNLDRLSSGQKRSFLSLIETYERGPYPGPSLDVLGALCKAPELTADVIQRLCAWVNNGAFDRVDPQSRSETPALIFEFLAGLMRAGFRQQALPLVAALQLRIKKLFRSAEDDKLVNALRWISKADRLPLQERRIIEKPYLEGVYSTEFERGRHAELVSHLAMLLVGSVTQHETVPYEVEQKVRSKLKEAGFALELC